MESLHCASLDVVGPTRPERLVQLLHLGGGCVHPAGAMADTFSRASTALETLRPAFGDDAARLSIFDDHVDSASVLAARARFLRNLYAYASSWRDGTKPAMARHAATAAAERAADDVAGNGRPQDPHRSAQHGSRQHAPVRRARACGRFPPPRARISRSDEQIQSWAWPRRAFGITRHGTARRCCASLAGARTRPYVPPRWLSGPHHSDPVPFICARDRTGARTLTQSYRGMYLWNVKTLYYFWRELDQALVRRRLTRHLINRTGSGAWVLTRPPPSSRVICRCGDWTRCSVGGAPSRLQHVLHEL